jgi:hypothetical protein
MIKQPMLDFIGVKAQLRARLVRRQSGKRMEPFLFKSGIAALAHRPIRLHTTLLRNVPGTPPGAKKDARFFSSQIKVASENQKPI